LLYNRGNVAISLLYTLLYIIYRLVKNIKKTLKNIKNTKPKNCPMFSLRSNSIESRSRSILGAIFRQISL